MFLNRAKRLYFVASRQPQSFLPYIVHNAETIARDKLGRQRSTYISHLGAIRGNAGDVLIALTQRRLFDTVFGRQTWVNEPMKRPVGQDDIDRIVSHAKAVVIGGGGVLMPSNGNKWPENYSDWAWNIPIEYMDRIQSPIVVFAVGYNKMRGERDFLPVFGPHIERLIEKSMFFGVRNFGSIDALTQKIPANLAEKLKFQPCPTNLMSLIDPTRWAAERNSSRRSVALVLFSGLKRAGVDALGPDISKIVEISRRLVSQGWSVDIATHTMNELEDATTIVKSVPGVRHVMVDVMSAEMMIKYYRKKNIVIGMRGHGVMMPYGLGVPTVGLINHDKVKYFMESVNLSDVCVELSSSNCVARIIEIVDEISENYQRYYDIIDSEKEKLWRITMQNMESFRSAF